ncbi:envelope stress response membrane protein PspC [Vibrio salinus]|uniref:envelope stress response membrane protein PspC n=1 Tax=Vibrio salinus TaxID=2899784 RepID=UPI001E4DE53F|nr:envelope stress response membrane protein PspC [Vibrio salinus]MCE0492645.1 envelope stress response membrane protein PspC [Vibrio salinus]
MANRELYRDPVNGKISGVCAGIANYFGLEVWLVRIIVISVTLLGGGFIVFLAYIALSLMLEKSTEHSGNNKDVFERAHTLKQRSWKQGEAPDKLLNNLSDDIEQIEQSVRNMEAYVTSEAYKVNKAFRNL